MHYCLLTSFVTDLSYLPEKKKKEKRIEKRKEQNENEKRERKESKNRKRTKKKERKKNKQRKQKKEKERKVSLHFPTGRFYEYDSWTLLGTLACFWLDANNTTLAGIKKLVAWCKREI